LPGIFAKDHVHVDKAFRIRERQWPPELRFEHAEDRSVGADAERQSEDDYDAESGILTENASSEAKITQESFNDWQAAAFAPSFFRLFEAAEFNESLAAGFLRRHSRANVVFDVKLEMAFQFRGELAFSARLTKEFGEAKE
jgi:hypothetical protein